MISSRKLGRFGWLLTTVCVVVVSSSNALKEVRPTATALSPTLVSSGLKNLGNTCYMNAQLQCAFHIPLLRKLALEEESISIPAVDDAEDNEDDKLVEEEGKEENPGPEVLPRIQKKEESSARIALREVFTEMIHSSATNLPAIAPRSFCFRLGIPHMVQQDSQEFWKLLLPVLENSSIQNLYKGYFESYFTALDGSGREKRKEENFLDISLDVGKSTTLLESLNATFGEPELLSVADGNGWRPEKGADRVDANKGASLIAMGLPSILQFHLKRFTYDPYTDTMTKINDRFAFPGELDLSSICKEGKSSDMGENDSTMYDLQSVVVHMGKYGMGHYYSYVRLDPKSDTWYRFNDDVVEKVTEKDVFEDAYGGRNRINSDTKIDTVVKEKKRGIPILGRLLRRLGQKGDSCTYGYGGSESNAYVVQYVRRSDLKKLYHLKE